MPRLEVTAAVPDGREMSPAAVTRVRSVSSRFHSDQHSPLHIFKLDIRNCVELVLLEIGFLREERGKGRKWGFGQGAAVL